jgi:leucyl/phenylalanyl-tRNA--protein transferase
MGRKCWVRHKGSEGIDVTLIDDTARSAALKSVPVERRQTEGLAQTLQRWVLGLLWSLKPPRLYGIPATLSMLAKHYAGLGLPSGGLPDPEKALHYPDGLVAICTDLSVPTLKAAYAKGLYPWAHVGPQKWWAPEERMVSLPGTFHVSKTVGRLLRNGRFKVTFDTAFADVIAACAEPRSGWMHLTWIRPEIIKAYQALHDAGYAHSVEVWDRAGKFAGGLYGVAVGKAFSIESMFTRQHHASKIGLVTLACHLQKWGFLLNDAKRDSAHWRDFGFTLIPRAKFNALLREACKDPGRPSRWAVDETLAVGHWDPKAGPVRQAAGLPL